MFKTDISLVMERLVNMSNVAQLEQSAVEMKSTVPNFGHGRYSPLMAESYKACQALFSLPSSVAEKIALAIGRDYGAVMSKGETGLGKVGFGKVNSDNKATVKEASQAVKNCTMTDALHTLRCIAWFADAGKYHVSYGKSKLVVSDELQKYFDSMAD